MHIETGKWELAICKERRNGRSNSSWYLLPQQCSVIVRRVSHEQECSPAWLLQYVESASEDKEEQGLMPGQYYVFHGAFHGTHLLWGGSQERQRPNPLLRTRVAEVATLVFLPVALQGRIRRKGKMTI